MTICELETRHLQHANKLLTHVKLDMRLKGIDQWDDSYPDESVLSDDISGSRAFGLFDGDELVGYIAIDEAQAEEYRAVEWKYVGGKILALHRLCVRPTGQRQGYADCIMEYAERYAKERGYSSIRLDTHHANKPALYLVESHDYEFAGTVSFRKGDFHCYEKKIGGDDGL